MEVMVPTSLISQRQTQTSVALVKVTGNSHFFYLLLGTGLKGPSIRHLYLLNQIFARCVT